MAVDMLPQCWWCDDQQMSRSAPALLGGLQNQARAHRPRATLRDCTQDCELAFASAQSEVLSCSKLSNG
jgi:hypothetical protein